MKTTYIFNGKRFNLFADLVNEFFTLKGYYPRKAKRTFYGFHTVLVYK